MELWGTENLCKRGSDHGKKVNQTSLKKPLTPEERSEGHMFCKGLKGENWNPILTLTAFIQIAVISYLGQ